MKKTLCFLFALIIMRGSKAQTFGEWFQQKETGIKYLVEQVMALKSYAATVQKGYALTQFGLDKISVSNGRDYTQQENHLASLKKVNPQIESYSKVAAFLVVQQSVLKQCTRTKRLASEEGVFNSVAVNYTNRVCGNIEAEAGALLDELIRLVRDGATMLSDAERLQRIEALYLAMKACYNAAQSFSSEIMLLSRVKKREWQDRKNLAHLFGVK